MARQCTDGVHGEAYQAYTSSHPGAVVVKLLYAVVTDGTVGAAGRPPVVAGGAPLGLDHEAVDLVLLERRAAPAHRLHVCKHKVELVDNDGSRS